MDTGSQFDEEDAFKSTDKVTSAIFYKKWWKRTPLPSCFIGRSFLVLSKENIVNYECAVAWSRISVSEEWRLLSEVSDVRLNILYSNLEGKEPEGRWSKVLICQIFAIPKLKADALKADPWL